MKKGFEDRIIGVPLPPRAEGEAPGVSAIERSRDGWRLTRRDLVSLLAAGAFAGLPRTARASCATGAFAHQIQVVSLSFSPDGQTLVSAGSDGYVKFWSLPSGALYRSVAAGQKPVQVAVSPDGSQIAVAMNNGGLELWPFAGGTPRELKGHTAAVEGVAFTPDGSQLVSVGLDRTTKVWSVANATLVESFADSSDVMLHAAVPRTARRRTGAAPGRDAARPSVASPAYLATSGAQVYLRSLQTGAIMQAVAGKAFALSPDGQFLAAQDGTKLYMYSLPNLVLNTFLVDKQSASSLSYSADGKLLAVAYTNAAAQIYSAPDLTLKVQTGAGAGPSYATAMDPQNKYLAVAAGRSIQLYQLPAASLLPTCFMDLAASAPGCSGIQYRYGGVVYTVGCGVALPSGAVCTCDCVPGGCSCVSDNGCGCDADVGCACDSDVGCSCVSDTGCACDSDVGCDCVGDVGCSCDSDYGCGCVDDTGCGCDGDSGGCGCDGDSGCGCDGEFG
jgi:WD40 repeat protein